MEKSFETEVVVEVEEAVEVKINFKDFNGDVRKWQQLYFEILSWKNTWGLTYEVNMNAYHDHSAYVRIVAKRDVKEHLIEWLKDIGYNKISSVDDVEVGTLGIYENNSIYDYYVQW